MDTQNTPIHIRLWHKDFWKLAFAEFALVTSISMLAVIAPERARILGLDMEETALMAVCYGIGLYALGPFCNYLVQNYCRNKVCLLMMALLALLLAALSWFTVHTLPMSHRVMCSVVFVSAFLTGATFGLSQMLLLSTLVIDECESFLRTEANHHMAWFGRFALSVGPCLALLLTAWNRTASLISIGFVVAAFLLVNLVKFPFKAPDEVPLLSLDRFFLPRGLTLFFCFLPVAMVVGMLVSAIRQPQFYALIMGGFLLAILAEKYVFANAELASQCVSGLICMIVALAMLLLRGNMPVVYSIAPVMLGFSVGIIGSRFLLFFVKLSDHCQRGTSQSTYILAWESGLALGLAAGYGLCHAHPSKVLQCGIVISVVVLAFYLLYVHPWYMRNKSR